MPFIAERLVLLRKRAKLSQVQLSQQAGSSQNAISMWEQGKRSPRGEALLRLAKALGVEPKELFDDWSPGPAPPLLTDEEARLLSLFRTMTSDQRALALRLLKAIR